MDTGLRDPRERFSDRVGNYVRYRPGYPPEVIEQLRRMVPGRRPVAADIGSGTGIFSLLLLRHGFSVLAVEPNRSMAEAAEKVLADEPGFRSIHAEAVQTTLEDSSVDAVTAAQAFHWFATTGAVTEFDRILSPGGVVLIVWNDRLTDSDRFHREYENLLVRYCTDYTTVTQTNITEKNIRELFPGWLCTSRTVPNRQRLDFDSLRGRLESSSYCPAPGHPAYPVVIETIRDLFQREQHGGVVGMDYVCRSYYLVRQ